MDRDTIPHELEFGQVYKDDRTGERIQLVYLDKNIYVLQDEQSNTHRIGRYSDFHDNVSSGRYSLQPMDEPFATTGALNRVRILRDQYQSSNGRTAEHKAEAIDEVLSILTDIGSEDEMEEIPFEKLDNIGQTAADNLRAAGYQNCGDVRRASDEEIGDVSWVGEKGVESIREWCNE